MAYGNYNNYNRGNPPRQPFRDTRQLPPEVNAEPLPADYVDVAEKVMRELFEAKSKITTSKIRNLHSFIIDIYNAEHLSVESELSPESVNKLTMMRIRVVYEYGRDASVREFVKKAKLLEYMKDVKNDRKKLIDFAHYMEALIAYHRYFGGKEG